VSYYDVDEILHVLREQIARITFHFAPEAVPKMDIQPIERLKPINRKGIKEKERKRKK